MSMKSKIKSFFGPSRQYAVAGASNNPSKYGFKVLSWYVQHNLPVIPINPKSTEILGQEVVADVTSIIEAVKGKKDLGMHQTSSAQGVSISFLTQPHITARTLKEMACVEGFRDIIEGLWFQPGSYDEEVLEVAEKIGLFNKVVFEDECILVRGEEGLYSANL